MMDKTLETLNQLLEEQRKTNAIFQMAFEKEISEGIRELLKEPVAKAIFNVLSFGEETSVIIKKLVSRAVNCSTKTVERRLNNLVEKGLLIKKSRGKSSIYQSSGLV